MKKILIFAIILEMTLSCNHIKKENFELIDYSCFGAHGVRSELISLKVLKDGKTYAYSDNDIMNTKIYSIFFINKYELDTISKLIKEINTLKFDSIYDFNCDRCLSYSIIINTENHKLKTSFHGQLLSEKNTRFIDLLAIQMNLLFKKYCNKSDSNFIFGSRDKLILPPHKD